MKRPLSEVRKEAWETRRKRYGNHGHNGSYARPCQTCKQAIAFIVRLLDEGTISEGQAAKATGLHRISLREMVDDRRLGRSV